MDTLAEIATALTENDDVVASLNDAIAKKADKATTEAALTALQSAMKTSDQPTSVAYDATAKGIVFTYKDGTKKTVVLPTPAAVYA